MVARVSEVGLTRAKQWLLGAAIVGIALFAGAWGFLHFSIQSDVDEFSARAQASFPSPGDDVSALIAYVQSDRHSLRERNHAVWSLGQLRDSRALPVLEAAFTGEPCHHDVALCQRELKKAIALCRGEAPNILFIRARRSR
jgi:hypothetical protein